MLTNLLKKVALLIIILGVAILFICLAPILIIGLWLLFWGLIALMVFSFIIWVIMEWLKED